MWSNIAEILTRVSTLASNNIVWKKIEESWFIRVFLKKKTNPKFGLFVQFNHPFPPEDGRNGENYKQYGGGWGGGLQPLGYPNMSKSRLYLLSFFLEKHDYFFVIFGLDFQIWLLFLVLRLYFWKKMSWIIWWRFQW